MPDTNLSPDIYGINKYVNELKKEFIAEANEDTLMLGIFGYTGQIFSDMLQNSIIMASEFSNESIPTKAKFEKNIIAHALGYGIESINAVPAQMDVLLTFIEDDIINWYEGKSPNTENDPIILNNDEHPWTFIFDKNNKIYFGDYEFHTDYDIIIKKVKVTTQGNKSKFAYTAQYRSEDFDIKNPVSDVTNPYLTPPVKVNIQGVNIIYTKCTIRQVEKATQSTKVLADNDVSAKTITFTFDGQLAAFSLDVTEGTETYHMVPVYDGLNVDVGNQLYFWYTYLDANTIRIKFDRNSRIPGVNASIQINLQTTQGSKGNFTFYGEEYPEFVFESERLNYSNITCQVRPINGNSLYGSDKKTIEELKEIIPKEALSRGSITNLTDLENYFNMLDNTYGKLYFFKKRDNCLERLYYSFLLMKNDLNIIPTNTINIVVSPEDLKADENKEKLILKQGQRVVLGSDPNSEAVILKDGEIPPEESSTEYLNKFTYYLPYDFVISKSPLYGMYVLTTMHFTKNLDFYYINENCLYQYIATKFSWDRNCLENHDIYSMKISIEQNFIGNENDTSAPIHNKLDENGNMTDEIVCDIAVYMVIYNEDNEALRWAKAERISEPSEAGIIDYQFQFKTNDNINTENKIRINTGLYDPGTNNESYADLNSNMTARIFIVSNQIESFGLGNPAISEIIPEIDSSWSLSNTYNVIGGLDFFFDYTEIVNSTVTVTDDGNYHINSVPVVKYDYFTDEEVAKQFYNELLSRKAYIDDSVLKLEDAFEMDFKFFNTYGPSRFFTWDNSLSLVDRVNISIFFKVKLKTIYDSNILEDIKADIKNYIEDINNIQSIHIPNLVTEITNKYKDSIVFFEFVSINGQDYQHMYSMDIPDGVIVPEFINIHTLTDGKPDIIIDEV